LVLADGSTNQSNYAFSLGFAPAANTVSSGSATNILYRQTIHIMANGSDAYIPYSTVAGTYTTAYPIVSTNVTGVRSNPTFVPDSTRSNYAFAVGGRIGGLGALDVTIGSGATQHLDPIQMNLNIIGADPSGSSTVNGFYQLINHDTTAMPHIRLKCADFTVAVAQNVLDAYAYQGEIVFSTNAVAVSGEACVMGLVLNAGTVGVTGGVRGLKISMGGSGMPAATSAGLSIDAATSAVLGHAIYIETQGGTTITNGLYMGNAGTFTTAIYLGGTITNFLNLTSAGNSGFVTTGGTDCTASAATDPSHTLKIIVPGGAAGYIRVWAAA